MPFPKSLTSAKYVLLTTFRKDGRAVPTPVWAVPDSDALAVWTVHDSGKVKRIRRNPAVTVAACDFRGRPHGEPIPARASICDATGNQRIRHLLGAKYGLVGRLSLLGSRLRRGAHGTVGIRIVPVQ